MNIVTKFAIATDESTDILLKLTKELATEKLSSILDPQILHNYIEEYYNRKYLVSEMNSMSNQWLMVYADDAAVGFARITSKGKTPQLLDDKRAVRIADFSILQKFSEPEIQESLFEKYLSVCRHVEGMWINEYIGNPIIEFFESKGFLPLPDTCEFDEIKLPSICLVRLNTKQKQEAI